MSPERPEAEASPRSAHDVRGDDPSSDDDLEYLRDDGFDDGGDGFDDGRGHGDDGRDDRPAGQGFLANLWGGIKEILIIAVMAIVLSFVVKTWLIQAFYIPSESMENTLVKDDRVIVSKLTPNPVHLQRGDIVVFQDPDHWLRGAVAVRRPRAGQRGAPRPAVRRPAARRLRRPPHQARHRYARRPRRRASAGRTRSPSTACRSRRTTSSRATSRTATPGLRHHRPAGAGLGDGGQPRGLGRLPLPRRRDRGDRLGADQATSPDGPS